MASCLLRMQTGETLRSVHFGRVTRRETRMALDTDRLQKTVRELRKAVKKFPKNPPPEDVHDLRTRTRRLEANLHSLSMDSKRSERRLLRRLRTVRSKAGKVRDMDVLTSHLSSANISQDQDCLVQLLEYLGAQRHKKARLLRKTVRSNAPELRKRLRRVAARMERLEPSDSKASSNPAPGSSEAAATALRLSADLANPKTLNRTNLHAYRLKVKELFYVLQMGESDKHETFVETLGKVKDAIGEWHDWEELIQIAAKVLDHGPQCSLMHSLKSISAQRFEAALSVASKLRRDFVPQPRAKSRAASEAQQRTLKAISLVAA
jgi:CHAD domain-containing protein